MAIDPIAAAGLIGGLFGKKRAPTVSPEMRRLYQKIFEEMEKAGIRREELYKFILPEIMKAPVGLSEAEKRMMYETFAGEYERGLTRAREAELGRMARLGLAPLQTMPAFRRGERERAERLAGTRKELSMRDIEMQRADLARKLASAMGMYGAEQPLAGAQMIAGLEPTRLEQLMAGQKAETERWTGIGEALGGLRRPREEGFLPGEEWWRRRRRKGEEIFIPPYA